MNNPHIKSRNVVTRFYNKIIFEGNKVIKGAPQDRFYKEIGWFKEAKKRIPNNIPHIYNYDKKITANVDNLKYYEMQCIDGTNLYEWIDDNKKTFPKVFAKFINLVKAMHNETFEPKPDDIFNMYLSKPKDALVKFIRESKIDCNNIVINNNKFSDPVKELERKYYELEEKLLDTRYSFIHGDLTMSNTLINDKEELYLIDPRGGFGSTSIYGDVRYDIAKIYYSIIGNFDSLNIGKYTYKQDNEPLKGHHYSIVNNELGSYRKDIIKLFGEDEEIIRYIHATIWLSLIPHVANNPEQQLCTFCKGVELLNTINDYEKQ
ncbi:phosphotransferase [Candidatus Dojkabacteria bacterium]|nr:phosphotransferase [Candidatus Dojkabacteria bacterium]